jgi:uncharacterized protein YndB with AHSA1/START domain
MMPTMLNQPEPACLVIADISGYTSYLAGVELDHAQDILADLMDTVVGSLRPTFRLAKLEGDAVFTYSPMATIDASSLMDTIERTYFAFRRRLRDIGQASTCDCNACTRMPTLDLKVLAHHGTIVRQRMAGREELVGSDVILAHRLLKNEVTERTGARAYALYTEACLRAAGVEATSLGLIEHRETYDHIGEVVGWVADLGAAWVAEQDRTRVVVEPSAAMTTVEYDLPGPPAVAWDYLTSPARRPRWQAGVSEVIEATAGGRRGVGTTNHCVHGKDAILEEILDWRPPEYFTMRWQMPIPNSPRIRMMEALEATPTGTHVTMRMERPRSAKDRAFLEGMLPQLGPMFEAGIAALRPLLQAELARRAAEAATAPEPGVPGSAGRFLTGPVDPAAVRSSSSQRVSTVAPDQ